MPNILFYIHIVKSKEIDPIRFNSFLSGCIFYGCIIVVMAIAINFYNKRKLVAIEIYNVIQHRNLSMELEAFDLFTLNLLP